jgi:hypothetical protein
MLGPGCFSLFRGSALMDANVMAKYTTKYQSYKTFFFVTDAPDK